MKSCLIDINNLQVIIDNQKILDNLNLKINSGETHALMGPNGSGKSTLAYTIMGHPSCKITNGSIIFNNIDITDLPVDKRAKLGLFLAFQYPQEIPGLQIFSYLKAAHLAFTGQSLSIAEFKILLEDCMNQLDIDSSFAYRNLNEGFSGGEKKRIEMLQLMILNPTLAILDEIDSGLDVDALKIVGNALQICKKRNPNFTLIVVTHYQRILDYIKPDYVHIVYNGNIIKSGESSLAQEIENKGYDEYAKGKSQQTLHI